MNKKVTWLSGLLALQLLLAVGIFYGENTTNGEVQVHPLLAFDKAGVNKVIINGGKEELDLQKRDGQWILPTLDNLPVDSAKLQKLLDSLAALKTNWPVATTSGSHERFKVAKDDFQRKVQLLAGDKVVGQLLVGTSPGFKKSNVRVPGDDAVYALAINSYDLPTRSTDWLDKTLLSAKDLDSIKGPDYQLQKTTGKWQLADSGQDNANTDGNTLDQKKAQQLSDAFAKLRVLDIARDNPDFSTADTVTIDVKGAQSREYQLLKHDDKYYIRRGDIKPAFMLSQYDYDRLAGVKRGSLWASTDNGKESGKDAKPVNSLAHGSAPAPAKTGGKS